MIVSGHEFPADQCRHEGSRAPKGALLLPIRPVSAIRVSKPLMVITCRPVPVLWPVLDQFMSWLFCVKHQVVP